MTLPTLSTSPLPPPQASVRSQVCCVTATMSEPKAVRRPKGMRPTAECDFPPIAAVPADYFVQNASRLITVTGEPPGSHGNGCPRAPKPAGYAVVPRPRSVTRQPG